MNSKEEKKLSLLTDVQLEARCNILEIMIHKCKDDKNRPFLNKLFQSLINEQVRRDLTK